MNVKRTISGGVLDSAMASLATFLVGVQAVRVLSPASLGAYALVFSAFTVLMEVAARLVLFPMEVHASRLPPSQRMSLLPQSLRLAAGPVVVAGLALAALAPLMPAEVAPDVAFALIATAIPTTMVSPIQDHLRKVLHIGGQSSRAAAVSAVQLVVVAVALVTMDIADIGRAWHPFGSLLMANVVSTCVAAAMWFSHRGPAAVDAPSFAVLRQSGRWHLLGGAAPKIGAFATASLVAHIAGATVLGYAEGGRVLARPVGVLSQGLKSSMGPHLMRAAAELDHAAARRLSRIYAGILGLCGGTYLLLGGFPWPLNPLAGFLPAAYAVPGLAAAMIAVFTLDRVAGAGAELALFGAGREREVAVVETVASAGQLIAGATAGLTGAFAIPLGYLLTAVVRRPWLALHMRQVYKAQPASGQAASQPAAAPTAAPRTDPGTGATGG